MPAAAPAAPAPSPICSRASATLPGSPSDSRQCKLDIPNHGNAVWVLGVWQWTPKRCLVLLHQLVCATSTLQPSQDKGRGRVYATLLCLLIQGGACPLPQYLAFAPAAADRACSLTAVCILHNGCWSHEVLSPLQVSGQLQCAGRQRQCSRRPGSGGGRLPVWSCAGAAAADWGCPKHGPCSAAGRCTSAAWQ